MLIPVDAGANRVHITFTQTWDRKWGAGISLVAFFLILVSLLHEAKAPSIPTRAKWPVR
jgi:hypothetical protein